MAIAHHPAPESLMSCSAGSMPEAFAAVMACHIAMCPACRRELAMLQQVGLTLVETIAPVAVDNAAPIMAARSLEAELEEPRIETENGNVPAPLRGAVGRSLDRVAWSPVAPGVSQHRIALSHDGDTSLRLVKVAPGHVLPEHGHGGQELTLVLRGAFADGGKHYAVGDVADICEAVEHAPSADEKEGCICLVATIGRLKFKSTLARLVQPLTGF